MKILVLMYLFHQCVVVAGQTNTDESFLSGTGAPTFRTITSESTTTTEATTTPPTPAMAGVAPTFRTATTASATSTETMTPQPTVRLVTSGEAGAAGVGSSLDEPSPSPSASSSPDSPGTFREVMGSDTISTSDSRTNDPLIPAAAPSSLTTGPASSKATTDSSIVTQHSSKDDTNSNSNASGHLHSGNASSSGSRQQNKADDSSSSIFSIIDASSGVKSTSASGSDLDYSGRVSNQSSASFPGSTSSGATLQCSALALSVLMLAFAGLS
ncbi:unnamed protein product [Phytophthora lilii]|uniref:Unnamed protein product n=1 Tax=Phytophthora lilii TaxID=2077276 RepID=A0A9W6TC85_9STRA|nr:unnamed protein product [Phytophthora lilii]